MQCGLRFVGSSLLRGGATQLHTLRLCNCSLGPSAAKSLSRAIGPTLRRLELDKNLLSGSRLAFDAAAAAGPSPTDSDGSQQAEQAGEVGEAGEAEGTEDEEVLSDEEEASILALQEARRQRQQEQYERSREVVPLYRPAVQQQHPKEKEKRQWCRDSDITGLVMLARRLREQHAESGMMMQLTASENHLGDAGQAVVGPFLRCAAQALPTTSWLERRRRDRRAKAKLVAGQLGGVVGGDSGDWASAGELSTMQSNVWRGDARSQTKLNATIT